MFYGGRVDLVGTTADFRRSGPRRPLPLNDLASENRGTAGRIGEVRLGGRFDRARFASVALRSTNDDWEALCAGKYDPAAALRLIQKVTLY
jgi:hypothetical protein